MGYRFNAPAGWPTPPEDWRPAASWSPDASWPAPPRNWRFWTVNGAPVRSRRPRVVRLLLLLAIVILFYAIAGAAGYVAVSMVDAATFSTYEEYSTAVDEAASGVSGLAILAAVAGLVVACSRVSYRWFDGFLVFIPVYGLIFMITILWRVTNLPHNDWPLRPDERPWRYPGPSIENSLSEK